MTDSTFNRPGYVPDLSTVAVPRHPVPDHRPQRVTWAALVPYIVAVAALALAAVSMTILMLFKGSAESQLTELRQEVASAQQAQTATAGTVTGLSRRVNGIAANLNAVGTLVSPFTTVCSTDLTGPNGPAQYDFLCRQH